MDDDWTISKNVSRLVKINIIAHQEPLGDLGIVNECDVDSTLIRSPRQRLGSNGFILNPLLPPHPVQSPRQRLSDRVLGPTDQIVEPAGGGHDRPWEHVLRGSLRGRTAPRSAVIKRQTVLVHLPASC